MLRNFFKVFANILIRKETDLREISRLSENEAAAFARNYTESVGCDLDGFVQERPHLSYQQKKLVWDVIFSPVKNGLPLRGGHLRLLIDDETGEVIKRFDGIR